MTPKLELDLPRLDVDRPANILVVDDDADIRGLVELTLSNAGYEVTTGPPCPAFDYGRSPARTGELFMKQRSALARRFGEARVRRQRHAELESRIRGHTAIRRKRRSARRRSASICVRSASTPSKRRSSRRRRTKPSRTERP